VTSGNFCVKVQIKVSASYVNVGKTWYFVELVVFVAFIAKKMYREFCKVVCVIVTCAVAACCTTAATSNPLTEASMRFCETGI